MLYNDRVRAGSFGEDAELYDRARPTYPSGLIDRLLRERPTTALDVGCGTGIASQLLLERGVELLGLEPDARMAAVARRRGLAVEEGTFESWDPQGRLFDLLTSAQAWHWVEPVGGARKAAQVVRGGGHIGLFWNLGRPSESFRSVIDPVYARLAPGLEEYSVLLGRGEHTRPVLAGETLAASGQWSEVQMETFPWERSYRTHEWLDHILTHSDHRGLPRQQRDALLAGVGAVIDELGGSFVMHYETALVTATKSR